MKYEHRICNFAIDRGLLIEINENLNRAEKKAFLELIIKRYLYGDMSDWSEEMIAEIPMPPMESERFDIFMSYLKKWSTALTNAEKHKRIKEIE